MTVQKRLAAFGLVILVAGCGPAPVAEPVPAPVPVVRQVSTDVATLVSAVDAFGLDLLTAPALADETNLVVSPVSISLALQMVGVGAVGQTAEEIRKVLHLPEGELPQHQPDRHRPDRRQDQGPVPAWQDQQ
jgi:serpin B